MFLTGTGSAVQEITHFHVFCGAGGAARGGRHVEVSAPGAGRATFRCLGGVDVEPGLVEAFSRYVGARGTLLDLFSAEQFAAYHGNRPPAGWREATAEDLRAAAGGEAPDVIVSSPPCRGFSGLVSESRLTSARYRALNELTLRGIALALEAWADDPPSFWLLENVPRLVNRGEALLAEIVGRLEAAGYSVAWTIPDLGEIGGLAQSRKRLHLVARHRERVPVHVFEPPRRRLRAVGEVLGPMPLPGDPFAGPLHRLPRLEWRTWMRLALIPAGGDWRDLQKLVVEGGVLRDYGVAAASWHNGILGVTSWGSPSGTITATGRATTGAHSVADPRYEEPLYRGMVGVSAWEEPGATITAEGSVTGGRHAIADPRPPYTGSYGQLGVQRWDRPGATVCAQHSPGQGPLSIADPRPPALPQAGEPYATSRHYGVQAWDEPAPCVTAAGRYDNGVGSIADPRMQLDPELTHRNVYAVTRWGDSARTVTGATGPNSGAGVIADPRPDGVRHNNCFRIVRWDGPSVAITAGQTPSAGGVAVEDPRLAWHDGASTSKLRVTPWDEAARCVTGADRVGSGAPAVADPRPPETEDAPPPLLIPALDARGVWLIQALDGTWHRPLTVLERAALQGMVDPETIGEFCAAFAGMTASAASVAVGNAIPPPAMAETLRAAGVAILLARAGQTWALGSTPVWVAPLARSVLLGGAGS